VADQPTEIGIARKARDAAAEAEQLRAENARLIAQLDALRAAYPDPTRRHLAEMRLSRKEQL